MSAAGSALWLGGTIVVMALGMVHHYRQPLPPGLRRPFPWVAVLCIASAVVYVHSAGLK